MDEVKPVLLFLAEGFEDLEAILVLYIMGLTAYREWVPTVRVVTTGFRNRVNSRFGLNHQIDLAFDDVNPLDYSALAIPSGFHSHGFNEAYDERLRELSRGYQKRKFQFSGLVSRYQIPPPGQRSPGKHAASRLVAD